MDCRIPYLTVGSMVRVGAAAAMILVVIPGSGAFAQTLTDPNPPAKWSPPRPPAKSPSAASATPCPAYGAGFVKVAGTNTCVKIGGWVSVEGSASR